MVGRQAAPRVAGPEVLVFLGLDPDTALGIFMNGQGLATAVSSQPQEPTLGDHTERVRESACGSVSCRDGMVWGGGF